VRRLNTLKDSPRSDKTINDEALYCRVKGEQNET
jgi:hypothetical protein